MERTKAHDPIGILKPPTEITFVFPGCPGFKLIAPNPTTPSDLNDIARQLMDYSIFLLKQEATNGTR